MKNRIYLIASFILLGLMANASEKSQKRELKSTLNAIAEAGKNATDIEVDKNTPIKAYDNEVDIDLNNDTIISTDGVNVRYGALKLKVFNARRDKMANRAYINGDFFMEADDPTGKLKIDSRDGVFSLDGDYGIFGKTFGYLEVGQATGAEKPNDKIYFGGENTEYKNGNVYIKNAWFTTDPKIIRDINPMETGYHLSSELMTIEPDKQITFKNSDLYIGTRDIIPFTFPWYRVNIRQGSTVPLFPMWGTDDDYGWYVSWGALYGNKDSKFKGGFAPKFGDRIGTMIGRWENWYETEKYGTSKLNVTDWLVHKKASEDDTMRRFDRWDVDYTHNYSGEYGKLDFAYRNATYNMIPSLKDAIEDYDIQGKLQKTNWKYVNGVPDFGGNVGFYSLNTDLTGLGENKDISIKAETKLVSNKKAYELLVADQLDDLGYDSVSDYDLFSNVSIKKENERYSMGGYYKYLYDMDPGSTPNDLQSRAEDFGFNFDDKKYKFSVKYDEKNGDKFRRLNSWERDPNLSNYSAVTESGIKLDYIPWTVSQYSIYDSRDLKLTAGEYDFIGNSKYKVGYDYNYFEHKLSLDDDPFREKQIVNNERAKEYNRYENLIYDKYDENRGYIQFRKDYTTLTLAGGQTREEVWDREGIYNYLSEDTSYTKYINNSNFYEIGLAQERIGLGKLGDLALDGNLRYDQYTDGYLTSKVSTDDGSTRSRFGLSHNVDIYDNTWNKNRFADVEIKNNFKYFNQNYSYDSGDKNGMNKGIRLRHQENKNQFADVISFGFGNTETVYTIDYTEAKRASTDKKKYETINQKLDFKIDEENTLGFEYSQDKRFTDGGAFREYIDKNHNDLTFRNYGVNYTYSNTTLYFRNRQIRSNILDTNSIFEIPSGYRYDGAKEKIDENIYGYIGKFGSNRLNLEFTSGKDNRFNVTQNKQEINSKNKIYSASYLVGGDVEHYYKASYEDYKHLGNPDIEQWNSDVIFLRYDYRDKRFTDEELVSYAASEYKKTPDQLTSEDIGRIRQVLNDRANNRQSTRFNLNRIMDNEIYFGDYKHSLSTSLMLQKNDKRYDQTGDYLKSLEEVEGRFFYSYNRLGAGYIYNQKSGYSGNNWQDTEKEHQFSLQAKIGKPSEGWRIKNYIKFYDNLKGNQTGVNAGRRTFDGIGVEIGKEFGYYEWAVAYERSYSYNTRDYEWQAAIQFKLLTFPSMNIFGLGASADTQGKVSPDTYLFSGMKIKDIDD